MKLDANDKATLQKCIEEFEMALEEDDKDFLLEVLDCHGNCTGLMRLISKLYREVYANDPK